MPNVGLKSIYEKLQTVRVELKKMELKKTGKHASQGFKYYELADFLPQATDLFATNGLCPVYFLEKRMMGNEMDYDTVEMAVLDIYDYDGNKIRFETPTAENTIYKNEYIDGKPTGKQVVVAQNDIQNLGSKKTYIKRYLYTDALDLVEFDSVDSGKEPLTDEIIENMVKPTMKPVTKKVVKEPIGVNEGALLSSESKLEIKALLEEKKLDVPKSIAKIAELLGVSMALMLENQKEEIIKLIEGGKVNE